MRAYERKGQLYFYCPGCQEVHSASIDPSRAREMRDGSRPVWEWNGSTELPSLTPSVNYPGYCHFHLKEGRIAYQEDCSHNLKGMTVDLPDIEERK